MRFLISVALLIVISSSILLVQGKVHENEVVVRIYGGHKAAKRLAREFGHIYKGPVRGFRDTYLLIELPQEPSGYSKRGVITKRLVDDNRVLWADSQNSKPRQKRDLEDETEIEIQRLSRKGIVKRPLQLPYDRTFNDELWTQQWYMHDTRTLQELPKLDLNVLPVYKAGVTGKGVRVCIVDDGIEYTHTDLWHNYDPEISYDCNDDDDDPYPRYDNTLDNSHGTRCAGEVAMTANNRKCGVGIAYNARIGGVRLLDGMVNDRLEGIAIGYAHNLVDIYSASWGPNDDGKTVDGPGRLAREALERGILEGRGGKGSIYVWASGNGGLQGDNCNCDGYLTSIYTVSIGSASQRGEFPWYGEMCASTLAVTYSSGAYEDQMIATTELFNRCTIKHTGTSASAPLAAGIIALGLEANPNLNWRDVQHIIAWTSEFAPVANNTGWQENAAGLKFNPHFGFGLMNGFGFVSAASNWTSVPEKSVCDEKFNSITNNSVSYDNPLSVRFEVTGCKDTKDEVNYLEHIEIKASIDYTLRGALEIYLTSPAGTRVQILAPRPNDNATEGFQNWTFMSVATWGETPEGIWTLSINDNVGPRENQGQLKYILLVLHGTAEIPDHMRNGERIYNHEYNRLHSRFGKEINRLEQPNNYIDIIELANY